jgi:hypothetical protein
LVIQNRLINIIWNEVRIYSARINIKSLREM